MTPITRHPSIQVVEVIDYAAAGFDVRGPVPSNSFLVEPAFADAEERRSFRDTELAGRSFKGFHDILHVMTWQDTYANITGAAATTWSAHSRLF